MQKTLGKVSVDEFGRACAVEVDMKFVKAPRSNRMANFCEEISRLKARLYRVIYFWFLKYRVIPQ